MRNNNKICWNINSNMRMKSMRNIYIQLVYIRITLWLFNHIENEHAHNDRDTMDVCVCVERYKYFYRFVIINMLIGRWIWRRIYIIFTMTHNELWDTYVNKVLPPNNIMQSENQMKMHGTKCAAAGVAAIPFCHLGSCIICQNTTTYVKLLMQLHE